MEWFTDSGIQYLGLRRAGATTAVMLFHGYGADANDLASLHEVIDPQGAFDWYFPQGVLTVPIGPMMTGRGWFSLENRDWQSLMRGEIDDTPLSKKVQGTLTAAAKLANNLLASYESVFVGGFSQGAILVSHTFYRYNFVPKGLVLMSGYLVAPSEIPIVPPSLQVPFFQSHGRGDQVLPLVGAKKLYAKLNEAGLFGEFFEFAGGHEIPPSVIAKVKDFIRFKR